MILDLFTPLATVATEESTEQMMPSAAVTPTKGKSTTTVITATSTTSKAKTCTPSAAGRRKREVDNEKPFETDGNWYIFHIYLVLY